MTDEKIRIKIATILGWKTCPEIWINGVHHQVETWISPNDLATFDPKKPPSGYSAGRFVPDYTRDLNACAEFERALTHDEETRYVVNLFRVCGWNINHADDRLCVGNARNPVSAKAPQRCEAFLRTKGLIP